MTSLRSRGCSRSGRYVQKLEGSDEPIYEYVRATGLRPLLAALGGEGSEKAAACEAEYRKRALQAYPRGSDGATLFPFTRFFLIARYARGARAPPLFLRGEPPSSLLWWRGG